MSAPSVAAFDVLGPLPRGVAVLEASAGTGKTFTIAALAARYVADGIPLDAMLLVTFTRMATGELRERVRERLVSAEHALDAVLAGDPPPAGDAVAALLAHGTVAEVAERHARLAGAVADFDGATITTTHGFCLEALGSLGFAGDVGSDCSFVEDIGDLAREVVDDLYVRRFVHERPSIDRDEAGRIARAAIANPAAHLEPQHAPDGTLAAMRLRLAAAARAELERRKRHAQVMTYDDLLTRLEATLSGPAGDVVAARLRERYRVVLVDEFQDTDPTQWSIMRRAFAHPDGTLVLIGDPKQAIYAFRGADVYAYLDAKRAAATHATLSENWRSDQGLIDAYDRLFASAQLGDRDIVYRPVRATDAHRAPRLTGAPDPAALRVRIVDRDRIARTNRGYAAAAAAREAVAQDAADEIVALLASPAQLPDDRAGAATDARRPVQPGDIAVLVRRNRDAATIRERLEAAGVPAVINGAGSVFATTPARDWLALLEALERPSSAPRARAAALSAFVGWEAATVAQADEDRWESVHRRLHHWAHVLRTAGVASLQETITAREQLPARILSRQDGERELTDLRHVGPLLHREATDEHLGVAALTAWLRRRIADAAGETDEERSRRLESDAAAVQVLTIHRSKGLEFGIVFYPDLWQPSWIPDKVPEPVFFHDADRDGRRTLDVGLDGSAYGQHRLAHRHELRGEDLRLAYVALTRARHQAVVWWAGTWDSRDSALNRLVFDRPEDGSVPTDGRHVPTDAEARARFETLAAAVPGTISVTLAVPSRVPAVWAAAPEPEVELSAATLGRTVDRAWRRTSYSAITAQAHGAHDPRAGSEAQDGEDRDEEPPGDDAGASDGVAAAPAPPDPADPAEPALPLDAMASGVHVGTLVHDLLEVADFAAADLPAELARCLGARQARRPVALGDASVVVDGLDAALRTPLGPLVDGLRLCDLPRPDRLDELGFELPLAGAASSAGALTPATIGAVLRDHLDDTDPLHGYADRLDDPALDIVLRGYLTGSIDLVFRVTGPDGRARYGIADYKTNRLGTPGVPLRAGDYAVPALRAPMFWSHYALQGLLYTVALHRYLRWRVPGHDPERDIAGVFYLFLRGMTGPGAARPDVARGGVFAWRPSGALVSDLSDRLDRGAL